MHQTSSTGQPQKCLTTTISFNS